MKKIILRGRHSFIGKNCARLLKNKYLIQNYSKNLKINKKTNTYFFHLSAITSVTESFKNPNLTITTNTKLLIESLEFCKKNKVKLIFFSTAYQKDKAKFASPYALSKNICEEICKIYSKEFNIDVCIIRLTNIFGKYQKKNLINDMIKKLKIKKKLEVINYDKSRDYLYIKDLISALKKILDKFPKKINTYNISQNKNLKILDAILIMKNLLNSKSIIIKKKDKSLQSKFDNIKIRSYKFKNNFNWKPKFTFIEGIKDLISE